MTNDRWLHATSCRSAEELKDSGTVDVLFATFWRLPFIYVAMFLARAACIALFKPLFDCAGSGDGVFRQRILGNIHITAPPFSLSVICSLSSDSENSSDI